jgi:hypothetical protein
MAAAPMKPFPLRTDLRAYDLWKSVEVTLVDDKLGDDDAYRKSLRL